MTTTTERTDKPSLLRLAASVAAAMRRLSTDVDSAYASKRELELSLAHLRDTAEEFGPVARAAREWLHGEFRAGRVRSKRFRVTPSGQKLADEQLASGLAARLSNVTVAATRLAEALDAAMEEIREARP